MANRVKLSTDGLLISKPGVDVLTATADSDFLFNSNFPVTRLFMQGTGTMSGSTLTINFGVTLPRKPFVSCLLQRYTAANSGLGIEVWMYPAGQGSSASPICQVNVYYDKIIITNAYGQNWPVRYSVWIV